MEHDDEELWVHAPQEEEETVQRTVKKRGRPLGSKNSTPAAPSPAAVSQAASQAAAGVVGDRVCLHDGKRAGTIVTITSNGWRKLQLDEDPPGSSFSAHPPDYVLIDGNGKRAQPRASAAREAAARDAESFEKETFDGGAASPPSPAASPRSAASPPFQAQKKKRGRPPRLAEAPLGGAPADSAGAPSAKRGAGRPRVEGRGPGRPPGGGGGAAGRGAGRGAAARGPPQPPRQYDADAGRAAVWPPWGDSRRSVEDEFGVDLADVREYNRRARARGLTEAQLFRAYDEVSDKDAQLKDQDALLKDKDALLYKYKAAFDFLKLVKSAHMDTAGIAQHVLSSVEEKVEVTEEEKALVETKLNRVKADFDATLAATNAIKEELEDVCSLVDSMLSSKTKAALRLEGDDKRDAELKKYQDKIDEWVKSKDTLQAQAAAKEKASDAAAAVYKTTRARHDELVRQTDKICPASVLKQLRAEAALGGDKQKPRSAPTPPAAAPAPAEEDEVFEEATADEHSPGPMRGISKEVSTPAAARTPTTVSM